MEAAQSISEITQALREADRYWLFLSCGVHLTGSEIPSEIPAGIPLELYEWLELKAPDSGLTVSAMSNASAEVR